MLNKTIHQIASSFSKKGIRGKDRFRERKQQQDEDIKKIKEREITCRKKIDMFIMDDESKS